MIDLFKFDQSVAGSVIERSSASMGDKGSIIGRRIGSAFMPLGSRPISVVEWQEPHARWAEKIHLPLERDTSENCCYALCIYGCGKE